MDVFTRGSLSGVQLPDTEEPFIPLEVLPSYHVFQVTPDFI